VQRDQAGQRSVLDSIPVVRVLGHAVTVALDSGYRAGVTEVLLVVIGLLLIGLPLLALVADRVLPAPRRRPPPAPDTREKLIRKFHLTWQDTLEVEAAVREGRATRPDLQPAARGFAEHTLTPPTFRGRPLTTYPVAARWAWLVFAIAAVAFIAYAAALGSGISLSYLVIYGTGAALGIAARRRRRRAAAAALIANNPSPTPDHAHGNLNDSADPPPA